MKLNSALVRFFEAVVDKMPDEGRISLTIDSTGIYEVRYQTNKDIRCEKFISQTELETIAIGPALMGEMIAGTMLEEINWLRGGRHRFFE